MALNEPEKLIETSEKKYDNELCEVVDRIVKNNDYKIILLAGPSGSGKTTTAHIIKNKLINIGKRLRLYHLTTSFCLWIKCQCRKTAKRILNRYTL